MKNLSLTELRPLIIEWAKERNILFTENAPKQRLKLIEECGELASAVLKNDVKLQKDAIGDIFVVLVILSEQTGCPLDYDLDSYELSEGNDVYESLCFIAYVTEVVNAELSNLRDVCHKLNLDIIECANIAWNEIKDRKGKTVNGTFIKN